MASDSWTRIPLGEFVTLQRGHDLPDEHRRSGNVPILGSFGITGWHDEAKASGPGVTVGRSGASFGVVSYSPIDYWPLNTALYVIDFHGNDERFAYYFLKLFDFQGYNSGSAQPSLNRNFVHPVPVDVPPLAEQRAIAHILGTLDDKIELNRRMNETLEAMTLAIFTSWFVDFDPVRAKTEGRQPFGMDADTAALFPDRLQESYFGCIPTGWCVSKLGEALSVIETGGRPMGGVKDITEGVPSVGAESIVGIGRFDYKKTKFVPREFFEAMNKGHVRDGDVLLYKDGGRPGEFEPHVTIVGDGFPFSEYCINEHVYRLRTEPALPQPYLYFWLSCGSAMDEMRNRGTGVAVPGLNSTAVRELPVLLPPAAVLKAFEQRASPLIHRIFANCNESRTLASIRDALLPKLISGKLQVQNTDRIIGEHA